MRTPNRRFWRLSEAPGRIRADVFEILLLCSFEMPYNSENTRGNVSYTESVVEYQCIIHCNMKGIMMIKKNCWLIAVVVILIGLIMSERLVWPQEKSTRVRWEYKGVRVRDNDHIEKVLNEYGDDGWEVIAWQEPDFLLKRQKNGYTSSQSVKEKPVLDSPQTNEDIVEMYQEIINLQQQDLAEQLTLLEYGRGEPSGFAIAKVKLSEARIQLAKFQGEHDIVLKELRNIVQFYTEARKQLIPEIDKGQRPPQHLCEIEIALLEAKIRLAKATQ